jgi:hypothetical protein
MENEIYVPVIVHIFLVASSFPASLIGVRLSGSFEGHHCVIDSSGIKVIGAQNRHSDRTFGVAAVNRVWIAGGFDINLDDR